MGLLARAVFEQKAADPQALWQEILRHGLKSKAGVTVNLDTALRVSVMFACMRKLSAGCAQVPFKLFQTTEVDGLRQVAPATDHDLYDLMSEAPNDWTSSFEFRETMVLHASLGNAYAFINRTGLGKNLKISELILLKPHLVEKKQLDDYSIVYRVTGEKSGTTRDYPANAIWHLRGPSWDGVLGMDVLNLAREALGLAIATETTHAKLHANGVRPSGAYSVEGTLGAKGYEDLRNWLMKEHVGVDNAAAPMILDRGAKWLTQTLSGVDAQHLETRRFQIEETCRFMDVMPIMVGYSDKAVTYASAEQMFLAHVVHTLSPLWTRIEGSANLHLLTKAERKKGYYFKFLGQGLLRGSHKDRAEYYKAALGAGGSQPWMTPDEVRELEELNPFGGEAARLPPRSSGPQPQDPNQGNDNGA